MPPLGSSAVDAPALKRSVVPYHQQPLSTATPVPYEDVLKDTYNPAAKRRCLNAYNAVRWFCTFWFSMENLRYDWFLRQKLGPDGLAPVSIDLIAGFPRMRALQMPLDQVVTVLRGIETLVVSANGRQVRRRDQIQSGCMDGDVTSSC